MSQIDSIREEFKGFVYIIKECLNVEPSKRPSAQRLVELLASVESENKQ